MTELRRIQRPLLIAQGVYYLVSGVWPLIHRRSFEAVTGRKTDFWLVRTVGSLVAVVGAVLAIGARHDEPPAEIPLLAVGTALSLGAVDTVYAAKGRIARIYLADALIEAGLVGAFASVHAGNIVRMRQRPQRAVDLPAAGR
jgi:hypothetical protein